MPTLSPTICALPADADAYTICFYRALSESGAHIVAGSYSGRWLFANLRRGDFLHIHWPSFFYSHPSRWRTISRFAKFVFLLCGMRLIGIRLIWTAHNLYPHDKTNIRGVDWLARRFLIALSHRIFAHGTAAGVILEQEFPSARGKTALIKHGHWVGYYPRTCSQREARQRLGLDARGFVFVFVGICKEYKNLHYLIETFRELDSSETLLIAGKFPRSEYLEEIREIASTLPGKVMLHPGYIPDAELQYYLLASDAVVLPYRDVLTSGSAMLALSFGRPVVAPRMGFLEEVIQNNFGQLYDPQDPRGLLTAMRRIQTRVPPEQDLIEYARSFDWGETAQAVLRSLGSRVLT